MSKLMYKLGMFVIICAFALLVLVFYWLVYPYDIIELHTDKYKVIDKTVAIGEDVQLELDYCKKMEIEGYLHRSLVNHFVYNYADSISSVPVGCRKVVIKIQLPQNISTGEHYFKDTVIYKPNPIRTIKYVMESEHFMVVDK